VRGFTTVGVPGSDHRALVVDVSVGTAPQGGRTPEND
jgi:hypothetical protein